MFYLLLSTAASLLLLSIANDLVKVVRQVSRSYFSSAHVVPGPESPHWFFGHMKDIIKAGPSELHDLWHAKYGPVVRYRTMMNVDRLSTVDVRAIGHILNHSSDYIKPEQSRKFLTEILGEGLLVVEGETHRQQRRIMSPAFGMHQIRNMSGVFLDKAIQLRGMWLDKLRKNEFEVKPDNARASKIDVLPWLNRATLDIIGLAGFGYDLKALDDSSESGGELNQAMRSLLGSQGPSLLDMLHGVFAATRIIPSARDRRVKKARATIDRFGRQFLEDRKAAVRASTSSNLDGKVERKDFQDKDILGLLVRANMASDLSESSRMTDEEVLAQIPTMLFAGHETTAASMTWMIFLLSKHPDIQEKLRTELLACTEGDRPSMDTLNNFHYLDLVVRETLRLYSPVTGTIRAAAKDDVIPTEEEWVDVNGKKHSGVHVTKGDSIFIPTLLVNRSKEIWGEDALEFKPERWLNLPTATSAVPGVWSNMLSFLGGNRACIGWRFSLVETKAIAYTLFRAFRFELAVPADQIEQRSAGVTKPHIKDDIKAGPQLPVWVTPIMDDTA